jgi:hypothetical protein
MSRMMPHMATLRPAWRAWSAGLLGAACIAANLVSSPVHAATVRPSLDNLKVDFGVANQPGDLGWMTTSYVPWRYRYQ